MDQIVYKGNVMQKQTEGRFYINAYRTGTPVVGQIYRGWFDEYAYCYEDITNEFWGEEQEYVWSRVSHMFLVEYKPNWFERHFDKRFKEVAA
jgi:hypothetical protein